MRLEIKTNENYNKTTQEFQTLQTFVEGHHDEQQGHFYVWDYLGEVVVFKFIYSWVLGCHRLFIYDPYDDCLIDFNAGDFTDIGNWIFERICRRHSFDHHFEIAM